MKKAYILFYSIIATIIFVSYATLIKHQTPLIPRTVLFGNPEKASVRLSPDGNHLAYCAPVNGLLNIWVKTVGKNDDKAITNDTKRGIYNFSWAPNGKQLLYVQDNDGDENYQLFALDINTLEIKNFTLFEKVKAQIINLDKNYPNELLMAMNKENPKFFDVYHLDLIAGTLTLVAKNPGNITAWIAGNQMEIVGALQTDNDGSQTLLVRNNNNDAWRTLLKVGFEDTLKDELYSGILGFSKDDSLIYLNTSLGFNARSLIALNVKTGEQKTIATDEVYDIDHVIFNAITYEPDIVSWRKDRLDYKVINPALEEDFNRMQSHSTGELYIIQKTYDGQKWLIGFTHDTKSFEYYLYDFSTKQLTFLFYQRPELNNYMLASQEPISFTARDGLTIHGYITYPANTKRTDLPIVLLVHGGPFMRDVWGYNSAVQLIANRGYACLQVNYRGSSGYGKKFLAAGNQEWGGKMQNDLVDAVQWAINEKIADPKKIAIYGGSYDGYAALVGATFTPDLFCCAVDVCGPTNLMTVLKSLPPYWSLAQWETRIGKLTDEGFLKSRSPLYKIDQIKIPLLIAHGANDVRVTQAESDQLIQALKEKSLEYEYLVFPDEGHGLALPKNRFVFYTALEKFLAKHLGGHYES
jgi:dipeptidyl aminopeptidase/acylaminoacyl peptidase